MEISKELIVTHDLVYFIHTKDNHFLVPFLQQNKVSLKTNS